MDKILYHGTFLTMAENRPEPEAVLIRDGVIGGTGTLEEMRKLAFSFERSGIPAAGRQLKTVAPRSLQLRGGRCAGAEGISGDAFAEARPVADGNGI